TAGEPLSLRLYPNPATNALTLHIRSSKPQAGALFLYDMQGRLLQILKINVPLAAGNNIIHAAIDRHNIPAGIYFVKIQMGNTLRTCKVTLR
ncbi:MAG TPA: T9SS type A sorting domain-containing protein, partial [Chitinophagaceae bacterium]|nr:T9SS type A sorting domain-containing protein [Chitinophagaceae bacterium]